MKMKTRDQLLKYLSDNATDAELGELCFSVEDRISLDKSREKEVAAFINRLSPTVVKATVEEPKVETKKEPVQRIRKQLAFDILNNLKFGPQKVGYLANRLNMSSGKMSSALSVLVKRGEILFDGTEASLPQKGKT